MLVFNNQKKTLIVLVVCNENNNFPTIQYHNTQNFQKKKKKHNTQGKGGDKEYNGENVKEKVDTENNACRYLYVLDPQLL